MNLNSNLKNIWLEDLFPSTRAKILKILALNNEVNISQIIKLTKLNHNIVKHHLNFLKQLDFVEEKRFGRIRIFRYKIENLKAKAVKNLIDYIENYNNNLF